MNIGLHASARSEFAIPDVRDAVSSDEWQARTDLAACYRLVALFGWNSLIYNHISARVPGEEGCYLLNPFGLLYDEITASNLVKVDTNGRILGTTPHRVHPAGFTLHRAVHEARPDVACVMHTHTPANMAVAAMKRGLLPITQNAMMFHEEIAYHEFEGLVINMDENERLVRDLGEKSVMILKNHGLLIAARSIPHAFVMSFSLEEACEVQIKALSTGEELVIPSDEAVRHVASLGGMGRNESHPDFVVGDDPDSRIEWPAMLRLLDRIDPSFRE